MIMHRNAFTLATLYIYTSFDFIVTHPLVTSPGDGSNNVRPTLVINNDIDPLPIHDNFGTMRLGYSDSVKRVRIDDAPPGYGCFFWSDVQSESASDATETDGSTAEAEAEIETEIDASSSSPSEASLLQDRFVSKTFYSSNSSSSHSFVTFDPPIAPDYLTCFTMPDPMKPDNWVSVWMESYRLPLSSPLPPPSPREGRSSEVEPADLASDADYNLIHVPLSTTVSDGRLGGVTFESGILDLRRAALVHLPRFDPECMPIRGLTHEREEDLIRIAENRQLMDQVDDAIGIVCTAESQNGRLAE